MIKIRGMRREREKAASLATEQTDSSHLTDAHQYRGWIDFRLARERKREKGKARSIRQTETVLAIKTNLPG